MPQFIVPITVFHRGSCNPGILLLKLELPGNRGKASVAYPTRFYKWASSTTTVILERIPIVIDNGPPLPITALLF